MADQSSTTHRIGVIGIIGLLFFAIIADVLSLIPFVGTVVSPVFWVAVSFYLYLSGFGLINARRLTASIISMVAEMIPAIQALPLITVGVVAIIALSRAEERTGISFKVSGGSIQPTLNSSGRREPVYTPTPEDMSPSRNNDLAPLNMDGVRQPKK